MKKFLLSLAILFLFFSNGKAQLAAHAGNDTSICGGPGIILGANPAATGGTPPYTYAWITTDSLITDTTNAHPWSLFQSSNTYILKVTDFFGNHVFDTIAVTVWGSPSVSISVNDTVACYTTPFSFSSTVYLGAAPYLYYWDFGDSSYSSLANPMHSFNTPGIYQPNLLVTDAHGCQGVSVYGVLNMNILNCINYAVLPTNTTCFNSCDGSATVNPAGNYRYLWSNGDTASTATNLCAGNYSVTVMDSVLTPLDTLSVTIYQPAQLNAIASSTNATCYGAMNGTIVLTATGGTPPYTFVWSNGMTTQAASNLPAGTYSVTVVDGSGCSASAMAVITEPTPIVFGNPIVTDASGCGVCDGSIVVTASGGTGAFTFSLNGGPTFGSPMFDSLCPGVYICQVTDANGCNDTVVAFVNAAGNTLQVTATVNGQVTCSNPNGSITAAVSGGIPPIRYFWNTGDTTATITGLSSGFYYVSVTDSSGCSGFAIDTIFDQQSYTYYVYVSGTISNCGSNGIAIAQVSGGMPPFTYLWNTTPAQTTATATGLTVGNYTVTVTDSLGCLRTGSVNIYSTCYNIVQGYLYNDANGNCVKDSGETTLSGVSITASGGSGSYYGYANNNGFYTIQVSTAGNFNITASINNGWGGNCSTVNLCGTQTASFTGLGDTSNVNFGFGATTGFNLNIHPGWHPANPGFTKDYWVLYNQTSLPSYTGAATIVFKYDSILVFQNCNNSGVNNAAAHTITWTVSFVPYPMWDWNTVPRAYFTVPANTPLNYPLSQEFWITPTAGDCDISNNHLLVIDSIKGSRDPNEKEVSPAGDIYEEDSVLTYTIHFQNTGNDTTWFIIVKDTLSQYVNPATVVNVASSHDYSSFDISDRGILTWVFNPIFLVDSMTNEPASKGFVMFKVKKKSNLPLTTQITNKAHIYFDYNEPVVTNTVTNTVTLPNYIFTIWGDENISVAAMPNPFTQSTQIVVEGIDSAFDFELFDITGKVIKKISSLHENRFELKREDMSAGVYFYRITTTAKQRAYGRVVVE